MRAQLPKAPVPPAGAESDGPVRELDRVRILQAVMGDDDLTVPVGATGTVVAVYADGAAFEVEFTEPVGTLATVEADTVCRVEPAVTDRKAARGRPLKREHRCLPDMEQAAEAFMAADLPWLAPEARETLAATAEIHGRSDGEAALPTARGVRR